jgi:hypothetical protein
MSLIKVLRQNDMWARPQSLFAQGRIEGSLELF